MTNGGVPPPSRFPFLKEPVNALTHAFGAFAAVAATVLLVRMSWGDPLAVFSLVTFGVTSFLLFTASTTLHSVRASPGLEVWLRRVDHSAIFLLIAGTYTPVVLLALRETHARLGWWLFGVTWTVALAGLIFKFAWISAPRWLSTGLYLAMGWLAVAALGPLIRGLGVSGSVWLLAGGFAYTVGAVVYGSKRPNLRPGVFGFHELWHVFVLIGWGCHLALMIGLAGSPT